MNENANKTVNNKKYIYVIEHANKLMQMGFRCLETGFNAKSQKIYWAFDHKEIQPYYESDRYKNKH